MMPPDAMRELVAGGVAIRRMLIDPDTGELLDLTPRTWRLPRIQRTELDAPVVLGVILTTELWQAITDGTADPAMLQALAEAPQAVRDMLAHAWSADTLDDTPPPCSSIVRRSSSNSSVIRSRSTRLTRRNCASRTAAACTCVKPYERLNASCASETVPAASITSKMPRQSV